MRLLPLQAVGNERKGCPYPAAPSLLATVMMLLLLSWLCLTNISKSGDPLYNDCEDEDVFDSPRGFDSP